MFSTSDTDVLEQADVLENRGYFFSLTKLGFLFFVPPPCFSLPSFLFIFLEFPPHFRFYLKTLTV